MGMFDGIDDVSDEATYFTEGDYIVALRGLKSETRWDGAPLFIVETEIIDVVTPMETRVLKSPSGESVRIEGSLNVGQTPSRVINLNQNRNMSLKEIKAIVTSLEGCLPEDARLSLQEGMSFKDAVDTYIENSAELDGIHMMVKARNNDKRVTEKGKNPFCNADFIAIPPENQPA